MFSLLGLWERHLQWVHRIYLFRVLFVSCSFPGHAWGMFPWNREQCFTLHQPAQQQSIPPCLICSQEPFSDHVMGSFFSILPSSHFRQHCYRYIHYHGIKKKKKFKYHADENKYLILLDKIENFLHQIVPLELWLVQNLLRLSVPVVILQHFHIIFHIFFLLDKKYDIICSQSENKMWLYLLHVSQRARHWKPNLLWPHESAVVVYLLKNACLA